ncbi:MAG: Essential protein Yae1, N terminal [Candelina mexicana]|nr:MAG: Essential protein Yae1, N terminal [Candelina mexicana]
MSIPQADEQLSTLIASTTIVSSSPPPTSINDLSDIFFSSPTSTSTAQTTLPINEPSDIPRIRSIHSTNGYRDGISTSKTRFIQEGFDEGYTLSAVLGLRIGWILGVLEGICSALSAKPAEQSRVRKLLGDAKRELRTENVFSRDLFEEDGTWVFHVEGMEKDGDVMFEDVADAHPVIGKWRRIIEREVEKWGLDLRVFEGREWEERRQKEEIVES